VGLGEPATEERLGRIVNDRRILGIVMAMVSGGYGSWVVGQADLPVTTGVVTGFFVGAVLLALAP
jgi:hypothetical protein